MPSIKSEPKQQYEHHWQFEAIGTWWSIETAHELSSEVKSVVNARIEEYDHAYSRFRDDSLVTQAAIRAGEYVFPDDAVELVALYRKLYDATGGAVTPLVGGTLESLGYDKSYSLVPGAKIPVPKWDEIMEWHGTTVKMHQPALLDFGAAGKGYLVDEVTAILENCEVDDYVIDASGDVRHHGVGEQIVGLENPYDESLVVGVARLSDASLCGSAINRRTWGEGMHHIIDGRTGRPANDVVATWVVAPTTALADGLATALFFAEVDDLLPISDFEYVRLSRSKNIEYSDDFVGELFV